MLNHKMTQLSLTTLVSLTLILLLGCSSYAEVRKDTSLANKGYATANRLVSTTWVNSNRNHQNIKIIDIRKPEDYNAGHIPNAVNFPYTELQVDKNGISGMLPSAEYMEDKLRNLGISPEDTIVIYDHIKNLWSTRLLWTLDVYGHEDTRIMDGAWGLWETNALEISTDTSNIKVSKYSFSEPPNSDLVVNLEEVLQSLEENTTLILDTRSADEFTGRDIRSERGGHIPSSIHVEWLNNVDENGRFLKASALRELYSAVNVNNDLEIYTLCQTAVRATHSWFVLTDLLGYSNVAVYDGSWTEWGNRVDTPIDS